MLFARHTPEDESRVPLLSRRVQSRTIIHGFREITGAAAVRSTLS